MPCPDISRDTSLIDPFPLFSLQIILKDTIAWGNVFLLTYHDVFVTYRYNHTNSRPTDIPKCKQADKQRKKGKGNSYASFKYIGLVHFYITAATRWNLSFHRKRNRQYSSINVNQNIPILSIE